MGTLTVSAGIYGSGGLQEHDSCNPTLQAGRQADSPGRGGDDGRRPRAAGAAGGGIQGGARGEGSRLTILIL